MEMDKTLKENHDGSFLSVQQQKSFVTFNLGQENDNPEPKSMEDLKKHLNDLTGRLCEARSSRDAAIRKNVQLQEEHLASLRQMQDVISKLEGSNKMLQKERDVEIYAEIQNLEEEVEKVRCEKTELRIRMDNLSKDNASKEEKMNELSKAIKKLEVSIMQLENQNASLLENASEHKKKEQEYEMQKGAFNIVQQQLNKVESLLEQTKEELSEEKIRCRDFERMLSATENDLTTMKITMTEINQQMKELEEKRATEISQQIQERDEFNIVLKSKQELESKLETLDKEVNLLQTKLQEQINLCCDKEKIIAEQSSEKEALTQHLNQVIEELGLCKISIEKSTEENVKCKENMMQLEETIKQKDSSLIEKDQQIDKLHKAYSKAKETVQFLDTHSKELGDLVLEKENELKQAIKIKSKTEEDLEFIKEELQNTKTALEISLNDKDLTEKKLKELELLLKSQEENYNDKTKGLQSVISQLEEKNEVQQEKIEEIERNSSSLTEKVASLQNTNDKLNEDLKISNAKFKKQLNHLQSESTLLKNENSRILTDIMCCKETIAQQKTALEEAISKYENYKEKLDQVTKELESVETKKAETENRLQIQVLQQVKLIEYLQNQNEALLANKKKKKNFPFPINFRDHKQELVKEFKEPLTPANTPQMTPSSARILMKEMEVVHNLEKEAAILRENLAKLQTKKDGNGDSTTSTPAKSENRERLGGKNRVQEEEEEEEIAAEKNSGILKKIIFQSEKNDNFNVNCVKHIIDSSIFLLGCEEGLVSRRNSEDRELNYIVEIGDCGPVYQIEFIPLINYAVLVEGNDNRLALVNLSLLRACAEAAACSKPKVKLQYIPDIKNCHSFQVQRTTNREIFIVAVLEKSLKILFWEKDVFVFRHVLKTSPETITSYLVTPFSVIFLCGKVFELDIETFKMEEFLDESDESMMYALNACQDSNSTVSIVDVSKSNMMAGDFNFRVEYLFCFPDLGIFVDAYGRRSRSEDIMWLKLPIGVYYRHPDLFVLHFNSVEIISLKPTSYTKTRIINSLDSIAREVVDMPECNILNLPNVRFLGDGENSNSVIVGASTKSVFEILEVQTDKTKQDILSKFSDSTSIFESDSNQSVSEQSQASLTSDTYSELSFNKWPGKFSGGRFSKSLSALHRNAVEQEERQQEYGSKFRRCK